LRDGGGGPIGREVPREGVIVGLVGIVVSIAVLGFGLPLYRRRYEVKGWIGLLMLLVGTLGLVAFAGWLILGAYIDSHTS
jgi:uncharacterized membrane protein YcjF (UPF0283 family)